MSGEKKYFTRLAINFHKQFGNNVYINLRAEFFQVFSRICHNPDFYKIFPRI